MMIENITLHEGRFRFAGLTGTLRVRVKGRSGAFIGPRKLYIFCRSRGGRAVLKKASCTIVGAGKWRKKVCVV